MLEPGTRIDVTLEPLDDYLVIQPLDESETATGLIVPINEAAQCTTGIVVSVGPDVTDRRARRQGALPARGRLRGAARPVTATACASSSAKS